MSGGTDRNRELFETAPVAKALAIMAFPTVISQLISLAYSLADTHFVGRTGNPYMVAAVALVFPVYWVTTVLGNLFGVGGGSTMSRLLGRGDPEMARRVCTFCVYGAVGVCAVFSLLCLLFLDPLLTLLGASAETRDYTAQYLFWMVIIGTIPSVLSTVMAHLLRNAGFARPASLGLSMAALVNLALDPLFMFVLLPPGLEVAGAAVATVTSNVLAILYFIRQFRRLRDQSVLSLSLNTGFPERKRVLEVLGVGIPAAAAVFLYDVATMALNSMMAAHGDYQVAALGICLKAERLPLNIGVGLCHGMLPLAAYNYSSGNRKRMFDVIRYARLWGLCVAAVSVAVCLIFPDPIIRLFLDTTGGQTGTEATLAFGILFLRLRILSTPLAFLNFHTTYAFQAMGSGSTTLALGIVRQAVCYLPMLFLMNRIGGEAGLAGAQILSEIITLCVSCLVFRRRKKQLLSGSQV